MMIEKWDILDANGIPTGKKVIRGKNILKNGEYHLVVHIWPISSDGKILIQRRSDKKKLMPGEWAATGGAAISGESSVMAATRELYEELGIKRSPDEMKKITRIKRRNSLLDIWVAKCDFYKEKIILQKSEVAEVKLVSIYELKEMIESGIFHNYGDDYFNTVFEQINRSITANV